MIILIIEISILQIVLILVDVDDCSEPYAHATILIAVSS